MKTVFDFNFKNEKALIRVDFNVPQSEDLIVTDITRIISTKPTIDKILSDGGAVVLMTHLGRPRGKFVEKYSLKHIVNVVSEILKVSVKFVSDCIGEKVFDSIYSLKLGEVLLLENLRFYAEEEKNDKLFAEKLSKNGTIYVNDAFGTAHRAHASTSIIASFFKKKCLGLLMIKELEAIDKILKSGEKPVTVILGGSKISTKITVIKNLLPVIDNLIVGGGMAYTFIKSLGGKVGNSIYEKDKLDLALFILEEAKKYKVKIYLPVDTLISDKFNNVAKTKVVSIDNIPDSSQGLDIGKESIKIFKKVILSSKTIFWNGPLGVFEIENFSQGTKAIGNAIGEAKKLGSFSLVGGGDSVAFIKLNHYDDKFSYVSTGGGVILEALQGKTLIGVSSILD